MKGGDSEIRGVVGMTNGRGCEMVGLLVGIGGCQLYFLVPHRFHPESTRIRRNGTGIRRNPPEWHWNRYFGGLL
jgi:hypothetical protein